MNTFNLNLKIKSIGIVGSFTPAYSSAQKEEMGQIVLDLAPKWVGVEHPLINREEADLDWEDVKESLLGSYLGGTVSLVVAMEFNPFKSWENQEERIYSVEVDGKTSFMYYERIEKNRWKKIKDSHSK